jgi:hypothetical protein
MADALVSGASVRKDVEVQLLSAAPTKPALIPGWRCYAQRAVMVDPMVGFPLAMAALGVYEFVAARPLHGSIRWALSPRGTRWAGACTFAASLLTVALMVTHHSGIAFMTFALLTLAFAATAEVTTRSRRTSI